MSLTGRGGEGMDAMDEMAELALADGTTFVGTAFGACRGAAGEVVVATGPAGYPEALTDPAYQGQLLVLAAAHQGNHGVAPGPFESLRIQVRGLVVSQLAARPSHHAAARSLPAWLAAEGVPGLRGIDVRGLADHLRDRGAMTGRLRHAAPEGPAVSDPAPLGIRRYPAGPLHVLAIDPGMRESAVAALVRRGVSVTRYPADAPWHEALPHVDGVLVGSGPGDPAAWGELTARLAALLDGARPVLGICLGHQLLARAAGARTFPLRHGHRSANQPVLDLRTGRAYSTAQNHGYAVDPASLPAAWEAWCVNLHDGSNEGIRHRGRPIMGVQFHPEATPGPRDMAFVFDEFVAAVRQARRGRAGG